jgi:hypothetical protein
MGLFVLAYQQLLAARRGYRLPNTLISGQLLWKPRITLVKAVQNQCKNKISLVVTKVGICHFLNPEA